jgi:deoxyxylulose-5-phosphate synthase
MSISKTTGALSAYFSKIKLTDSYFYVKELTDKNRTIAKEKNFMISMF